MGKRRDGISSATLSERIVGTVKANRRLRRALTVLAVIATAMIAAGFIVSYASAATPQDGPVAAVRATIDEATPVFKDAALKPAERQQELRAIAARHFDFTYMARSAMGVHWKTLTAAERRQFVPTFTDYVMDTYLGTLRQSTVEEAGEGLKNKATFDGSDLAEVYGEVKMPNLAEPLKVNYSLRRDGGVWKLYDIVVDGVSTMANYRDEFNQKMNGGGFVKLENELKRKLASASG